MFFRKQKFFLDLSEPRDKEQETKGGAPSVTLAPPASAAAKGKAEQPPAAPPAAVAAPGPVSITVAAPAPSETPAAAAPPEAAAAPRTTAEEIAAQLAAEAASRPAPTFSTFAPDCLVPGAATPRRRRKAGANLGAFKEIAKGMMKS